MNTNIDDAQKRTEGEPPWRTGSAPVEAIKSVVRKWRLMKAQMSSRGKFQYGQNVALGKGVQIRSSEFCRFGNNVGTGSELLIEANLDVKDDVLISSRVSFIGNDHRYDDPEKTVFYSGRYPECTITLEGDNLIGNGAILIGPITIGRGCVIGAGSVVTKSLPPNTICAGVPARVIRPRFATKEEPAE